MGKKLALITGATDGIGKQTARNLHELGFDVIVHGRTPDKAETAATEIARESGSVVLDTVSADFASLAEVKEMAEALIDKYDKLDVLINNAGIFQNSFQRSREGYERTFAVNHLASFVLTMHLIPIIEAAQHGRIVNVASMAHSSSINPDQLNSPEHFGGYGAYGDSKLCNILFTYYLAKKAGNAFTVNALHPGVISTKLLRAGFGMGGGSLEEGARTSVYLAASAKVRDVTGRYFSDSQPRLSADVSYNEELQNELWDLSVSLARDFLPDPLPFR